MFHSKLDVILRMQVIAIFHNLNLSGFTENDDYFFLILLHTISVRQKASVIFRGNGDEDQKYLF